MISRQSSRPGFRIALAILSVMFTMAAFSFADEIVLKNGDRLTGTIDSAAAGQITITCPIEGKVIVDMSNVKTFSTTGPIKIVLDDGTVINQTVTEGSEGTFETAANGLLAVQAIPLAKIDKINPEPVQWHGTIAVNGSLSQGDTYSEQIGANMSIVRRGETDRIQTDAAYLFGKQKVNGATTTTNDQWYLTPAYDYFVSQKLYVNASVRVEKNRIQHLDIRVTPALGMGYQFVERPDFNANVEAGLSWVYEDYTNIGAPDENVSLRLAYHVDKTLWDKVKVFSDCAYFPGIQHTANYLVLVDGGLRVMLTKTMFSELRGEADYDSHPAPGSHRTQTIVTLGVGWTF